MCLFTIDSQPSREHYKRGGTFLFTILGRGTFFSDLCFPRVAGVTNVSFCSTSNFQSKIADIDYVIFKNIKYGNIYF